MRGLPGQRLHIRPIIEEWARATLEDDDSDVLRIPRAWQAVDDLGLVLVPLDGEPAITDFLLHVDVLRLPSAADQARRQVRLSRVRLSFRLIQRRSRPFTRDLELSPASTANRP
ncbi:hypothetical protein ABB07_12540 [Streptomyces incarnatus]|uniref:Uncharacterized protein n=1 Tax=Streptomyces incarnatus TaxID=665007 RepID=A0ABM5TIP5_9ACTN|nr:hypothetical protein ABB07_12540 [Streptomyces incarnatus]